MSKERYDRGLRKYDDYEIAEEELTEYPKGKAPSGEPGAYMKTYKQDDLIANGSIAPDEKVLDRFNRLVDMLSANGKIVFSVSSLPYKDEDIMETIMWGKKKKAPVENEGLLTNGGIKRGGEN